MWPSKGSCDALNFDRQLTMLVQVPTTIDNDTCVRNGKLKAHRIVQLSHRIF